jgi:hypothetical protein
LTIARMPARIGSGRLGQASMTVFRPGSACRVSAGVPPLVPPSPPEAPFSLGFSGSVALFEIRCRETGCGFETCTLPRRRSGHAGGGDANPVFLPESGTRD